MLLEFASAFLTLGLVQRWGERWPRWVPGLAGKGIPWRLVVRIAVLGALALSAVVGYFLVLFTWLGPHEGWRSPMTDSPAWAGWLMAAFYVPSLLWPVGLWVAIVGFWRRHARASQ